MATGRGKVWRACAAVWARIPAADVSVGDRVSERVVHKGLNAVLKLLASDMYQSGYQTLQPATLDWVAVAFARHGKGDGFVGYDDFANIVEQYVDFGAGTKAIKAAAVTAPEITNVAAGHARGRSESLDAGQIAHVDKLCRQAISFVDPEGMEAYNSSQAKTALAMAFTWLHLAMPPDVWHDMAFENFVGDGDGLIELADLCEIAMQHCEMQWGREKAVSSTAVATKSDSPACATSARACSQARVAPSAMKLVAATLVARGFQEAAWDELMLDKVQVQATFADTLSRINGSALPPVSWCSMAFDNYEEDSCGFISAEDAAEILDSWLELSPPVASCANGASAALRSPEVERRLARDGGSYTHAEFREFYGEIIGVSMWHEAEHVEQTLPHPDPRQSQPKSQLQLQPQSQLKLQPHSQPQSQSQSEPVSQGRPMSQLQPQSQLPPQSQERVQLQAQPQSQLQSQLQQPQSQQRSSQLGPQAQVQPQSGLQPQLQQPQSQSQLLSHRQSQLKPESQLQSQPQDEQPVEAGLQAQQQSPTVPQADMPKKSSAKRSAVEVAALAASTAAAARKAIGASARMQLPAKMGAKMQAVPEISPAPAGVDQKQSTVESQVAPLLAMSEVRSSVTPPAAPASPTAARVSATPQPPSSGLRGSSGSTGMPGPAGYPPPTLKEFADMPTTAEARSSVQVPSTQRDTGQDRLCDNVPQPRRAAMHEGETTKRKSVRIGEALLHEIAQDLMSEDEEREPGEAPRPASDAPSTRLTSVCSHRSSVTSRVSTITSQQPQASVHRKRKSIVPIASQILVPAYSGQLRVFEDYMFQEEQGSGAFGRIMKVQHKRMGLQRACKAISIRSPRMIELIQTEIDLMRRLDHPNVLRLFESYYDGDRNIYLIIELCQGADLAHRIKDASPGAMPEVQCAWALFDCMTALSYCHKKGVIHRDIKPDNLLYSFKELDSPLKVIDFGLSDFLSKIERKAATSGDRKKAGAARIGTPHYMAAEVYVDGIYDEKVDTFAAGVCLCEALTGVHPFFTLGKDNLDTIREKILRGSVDMKEAHWQCVPPQAQDLCGRLITTDREQRLDAGQALAHPWTLRGRALHSGEAQLQHKVFHSLSRFRDFNVLKQAAFRVLAKQLDDTQLGSLQRQFQLLDTDGDGTISVQELIDGAQRCKVILSLKEARSITETFGRVMVSPSCYASVGYSDFLGSLLECGITLHQPQLWEVFQRFANAGELITRTSLMICLTGLNANAAQIASQVQDGVPISMTGDEVSDSEMTQVFMELGNANGVIDFEGFCKIFQG